MVSKLERCIKDEQAMMQLGQQLAKICQPPFVIFLHGDLGAGKTTLTRGFLRGLGYQGAVKSPTFTLVETYNLKSVTLHHFDLYRIIDAEELDYIGLEEYFSAEALVVVEWAERGQRLLPKADLECHIEFLGKEGRQVQLNAHPEVLNKFSQISER